MHLLAVEPTALNLGSLPRGEPAWLHDPVEAYEPTTTRKSVTDPSRGIVRPRTGLARG